MPVPAQESDRTAVLNMLEKWHVAQRRAIDQIATVDLEILGAAVACFESREGAGHFLITPAKALGGRIPIEVATTVEGKRDVLQLIGRLEHGVYS